ncbi:hypothetical protein BDV96DRAFT_647018 [Lophiotrema nucula]|uniref:Uncharacterized protein n=1 Tax=Lophiotrema nucula TaxID=690887 RepID=A0A6A5Z4G8_9PLEO|nr:hypothetical protein BDV96DRAFT_647018 [Lophiotrema nucula]
MSGSSTKLKRKRDAKDDPPDRRFFPDKSLGGMPSELIRMITQKLSTRDLAFLVASFARERRTQAVLKLNDILYEIVDIDIGPSGLTEDVIRGASLQALLGLLKPSKRRKDRLRIKSLSFDYYSFANRESVKALEAAIAELHYLKVVVIPPFFDPPQLHVPGHLQDQFWGLKSLNPH